jgi:hypothetical protein
MFIGVDPYQVGLILLPIILQLDFEIAEIIPSTVTFLQTDQLPHEQFSA